MNHLRLSAFLISRGVQRCHFTQRQLLQNRLRPIHVTSATTTKRVVSSSSSPSAALPEHHDDEEEKEWIEGVAEDDNEDNSDENWMKNFHEFKAHLEELRKERGLSESDPPPYPATLKMRNWISKFRFYYRIGRFGNGPHDDERIELLESIGGMTTIVELHRLCVLSDIADERKYSSFLFPHSWY